MCSLHDDIIKLFTLHYEDFIWDFTVCAHAVHFLIRVRGKILAPKVTSLCDAIIDVILKYPEGRF